MDYDSSAEKWTVPLGDFSIAMGTQNYLVQGTLYNANFSQALLNATTRRGLQIDGVATSNGSLGDVVGDNSGGQNWKGHVGFPDALYPTTYLSPGENGFDGISPSSIAQLQGMLLGPVRLNDSYYLASFTVPILDSSTPQLDLLGFVTIVVEASLLLDIALSTSGYDASEQLIVVGPNLPTNYWPDSSRSDNDEIRYVLPPSRDTTLFNTTVTLGQYPAARSAYALGLSDPAKNSLDTNDPRGGQMSVG